MTSIEESPETGAESRGEWNGELNPLADPEERRVVFAALDSFRQYRKNTHYTTTHRRRQNLYALPRAHLAKLAAPPFSLLDTLNRVDDAIDANADVAEEILQVGLRSFSLPEEPETGSPLDWRGAATQNDIAKAHSTVRQFYRDWSAEGAGERERITGMVLGDLRHAFADHHTNNNPADSSPNSTSPENEPPQILVPGAGLARLLLALVLAGYDAEGNEISYHQLLASNWILNHTSHAAQFPLHPFATSFSNLRTRTQQLRCVHIPDLHPASALQHAQATGARVGAMGMAAGDFVGVYSAPAYAGRFDAVVSVFFLDTAPNVLRYIEAVRNCLRPGGAWVNVGPLLWHFDELGSAHQQKQQHNNTTSTSPAQNDNAAGGGGDGSKDGDADAGIGEPGSFELADDEVRALVGAMGFTVTKHEVLEEGVGYIQDPGSMLQNLYMVSHWVARKN